MTIYNARDVEIKILVCKKCRNSVEKGFDGYYSCKYCEAWVLNVEWLKVEVFS